MQPQQAPAYAASPLGSFPELSQMYATNFSTPISDANTSAQANQDQVTVANQKAAEAAAKEAAAAFADKNKYTIQQRSDGGFGFYGPDGKEVTAAQYAQNTGQKLTDVLKDSQNPVDIRYIQDQQNLIKYLQAKANSKYDPKQKAIASQIESQVNPLLQQQYGRSLDPKSANPISPIEFRSIMQQNYPSIYGANQNNAPGISGASTLIPGYGTANAQVEANNPFGFYTNQSSGGGLAGLRKR